MLINLVFIPPQKTENNDFYVYVQVEKFQRRTKGNRQKEKGMKNQRTLRVKGDLSDSLFINCPLPITGSNCHSGTANSCWPSTVGGF